MTVANTGSSSCCRKIRSLEMERRKLEVSPTTVSFSSVSSFSSSSESRRGSVKSSESESKAKGASLMSSRTGGLLLRGGEGGVC